MCPEGSQTALLVRAATGSNSRVNAALSEERARKELRATGEVVRRRDPAAIWQLTPQELQIALIVARGAGNRDAAAELFLSPRTVEYHLRKVFTKLGISSRAELVRMQLDGEQHAGAVGREAQPPVPPDANPVMHWWLHGCERIGWVR